MSSRYYFWKMLEIIAGSGWCFLPPGMIPLALVDSSSGQINLIPPETETRLESELQLLWWLVCFSITPTPSQNLTESAEPLLRGKPGTQMLIPLSLWDWRELCSLSQLLICHFQDWHLSWGEKCSKFWNFLSWFSSSLGSWPHIFLLPWEFFKGSVYFKYTYKNIMPIF